MFARMTRYSGTAADQFDTALERKRRVLPTEAGQVEGMKGAIFLASRERGDIVVISLWADEAALGASEESAASLRAEVSGAGESAAAERYEVVLFAVEQAPGVDTIGAS